MAKTNIGQALSNVIDRAEDVFECAVEAIHSLKSLGDVVKKQPPDDENDEGQGGANG